MSVIKHIRRSRRASGGRLIRKRSRVNQPQIAQPHIFHGSGNSADVAGMRCLYQNNPDLILKCFCPFLWKCAFVHC